MAVAVAEMLAGMPEPADLRRAEVDGRMVVTVGSTVLFDYAGADAGMRNLAVVVLTGLRFTGQRVAEVLGLSEEYVARLRTRAREQGSAGLVRRRGRPTKLTAAMLAQAGRWRAEGVSNVEIGRRLGVHDSTVSRALAAVAMAPVSAEQPAPAPVEPVPVEPVPGAVREQPVEALAEVSPQASAGDRPARDVQGARATRYAGAMLLHPFFDRAGVAAAFSGGHLGPARRYDDVGVLTATTVALALGIGSVEGAKHLIRGEVGAVVGLAAIPELRTLRERLSTIAQGSDPLGVHRAVAAGMLAADACPEQVYFLDDHFVPYAGARPLAKGYDTKRGKASRGRADTLVVDHTGRAVAFTSGEPKGLSVSLPDALAALQAVLADTAGRTATAGPGRLLLGFDRGGAFPVTFAHCRDADVDWVSYRRGPLVAPQSPPHRSWVARDGRRITMTVADETVQIAGYGPARQLTVYEHGAPALQILTSDSTAPAAKLACWLRDRWRIENAFKYLSDHHGIDWLTDYAMAIAADTALVANPARQAARAGVRTAEGTLTAAEQALARTLTDTTITVPAKNSALPGLQRDVERAAAALAAAKTDLAPIPAKLPANVVDPTARRATPRLAQRALQMACRLLAYNAEHWLANRLNTYLGDPDEYRAITRHLLHTGGVVHYRQDSIHVELDPPDSPRISRALRLLLDELTTTQAHIPGDRRPLSYTLHD